MSKIPSICMIPSGYKANKVYSVLPTNGDADLNFARASEATRVNQNGLIEKVGSNVPRIDYTDGGCPKLLLEPLSTNLITHSEDFSNAAWFKVGDGSALAPSVNSNQGISPNGTLDADRIDFDCVDDGVIGNRSRVSRAITILNSTNYTSSIYIKALSSSDVGKTLRLSLENVGNSIIITLTNEWVRYTITGTSTSTTANFILEARGTFTTQSCSALVWGVQLEQQSYATSYIPTSGATATRNAETLSKTGLSNYINSSEGVLYAEISALADDGTDRRILLSDGSINNTILIGYSRFTGNFSGSITSGGTLQTSGFAKTGITQTDNIKVAITWGNNVCKFYFNGIKEFEQTATSPINLDSLIFRDEPSTKDFYGKIKALKVYNQALTDAELIALTQV